MIQAKKDGCLDHCGNDGGVSVQILSILLVIKLSGFTNELYVDHERKMSEGWHQNFLEDGIPFGGRIPHFRRPVLNGFIISFLKKIYSAFRKKLKHLKDMFICWISVLFFTKLSGSVIE